jgi:hypothetical protein
MWATWFAGAELCAKLSGELAARAAVASGSAAPEQKQVKKFIWYKEILAGFVVSAVTELPLDMNNRVKLYPFGRSAEMSGAG